MNSKNPVFGPFLFHFPNFGGKNFFSPEDLALSRATSCGVLAPCQNLGKTIPRIIPRIQFQEYNSENTIPRIGWDRPKDGKTGCKDGQALFHRTLSPVPKI